MSAIHRPAKPLDQMTPEEREAEQVRLTQAAIEALQKEESVTKEERERQHDGEADERDDTD
jgi:hypothetical protein